MLVQKRYDEALLRAQKLLAVHPEHVGLLSIAASAAYGLGQFAEAKRLALRAIERAPDSQALREALARIERRLGRS